MELAQVSPGVAGPLLREGMETDGSDALATLRCPLLLIGAQARVNVERLLALQPEAWVGRVVGSGDWLTIAVSRAGECHVGPLSREPSLRPERPAGGPGAGDAARFTSSTGR